MADARLQGRRWRLFRRHGRRPPRRPLQALGAYTRTADDIRLDAGHILLMEPKYFLSSALMMLFRHLYASMRRQCHVPNMGRPSFPWPPVASRLDAWSARLMRRFLSYYAMPSAGQQASRRPLVLDEWPRARYSTLPLQHQRDVFGSSARTSPAEKQRTPLFAADARRACRARQEMMGAH